MNEDVPQRTDRPGVLEFPSTGSRPTILELVGPAGAGKTAVLSAIGRSDPQVRAGLKIDRLRFSLELARQAVGLIPTVAELWWGSPPSWWTPAVHLLRLRTLPAVLAHQARSAHRAIVLDEGPVFSLSRLNVFQNANRAGGRLTREWRSARQRCMAWLDGIVWLDAPDPVLMRRIRERGKVVIKGGTDAQLRELVIRYREIYREVLADVRSAGRVQILELDTARYSADQVAALILAALPRSRLAPASSGES